MFGSKARGDGDKESDIDILVVVSKEDNEFHDQLCEIITDMCIKCNVLISPVVFEKEEFCLYKRVRAPILLNIEKEGIVLWKMN
ncbi:MAG: nucleotidyltransferase domain-containing protein [bacterium]|nr:nucleotidyltransferase domain-containing protein [bacterium]